MRAAHILVAGGGIAGLASALALARRRHRIDLFEQAVAFAEVGAGIQLGPNVVRRLQTLGVWEPLMRIAAKPEALVVRSAVHGGEIARLPLGNAMLRSYGAPYLCVHRADLHGLLLAAVRGSGAVTLNTGARVTEAVARGGAVCVASTGMRAWEGDALVGADGLWSAVRARVVGDASLPRATGHTAWRALVAQSALPASLRSTQINVWLGPRLHAVAYPVRRGEALNVVVLAEAAPSGDARDWDQASSLATLQAATGRTDASLQALLEAMPAWRAWTLCDRPPLSGPEQMAGERVALAGDAAHPMLPYLAQGAGMAIEDGVALAEALDGCGAEEVPLRLERYARERWQRNAQVQARARRNGEIFHATGLMRMGRDAALRLLGSRLLDVPWLYGA
ncbi:FAD-dependent monooxygenase [Variovorax sp. JS1663]|uniref:FAD-dependent monooxygenase n=1 Tax=Variovorax sp. JS1663 TaxID=1851577 RepID=UPI000B342F29|nr:FAD-dependent monooxygenase [Variovorax sp. JS1663]OUM03582.1 FAD-dependent oxidoreductase [Variovorax sp. JS1663]